MTAHPGFIVVFDAGSSGTRVHIYNFLPHARDAAVPRVDPSVNDVQTLKQKPGLSFIAETYSAAEAAVHVANALNPLLDFARGFVPRAQWPSTPLVLKATAGLRAVEPRQAANVIDAVATIFSNSGFMFERNWAGIIPGNEEGGLAWVTANFLAGTFDHAGPATNDAAQPLGIIEMGGGSAQVSFRMHDLAAFDRLDDDPSRPPRKFLFTDIAGRRHNIYALSYLGFGQDHAKARLAAAVDARAAAESTPVEDPCYRAGYVRGGGAGNTAPADADAVTVKGGGDFDACRALVKDVLFDPHVPDQPPLIPGATESLDAAYTQPPLAGQFIATENFWYGRKSPDIVPAASLSMEPAYVQELGARYCAGAGQQDEQEGFDPANKLCFGIAFQTVFLEQLGATGDTTPRIAKNIGGSDLDWALGAAVVHFSTHEKQLTRMWGEHGWELLPPEGTGGPWGGSSGSLSGLAVDAAFRRPGSAVVVIMVVLAMVLMMARRQRVTRALGLASEAGGAGGSPARRLSSSLNKLV